ncbi:hypothetical protein AGMMS49990_05620 [Endomicrobiia bacterium]|nr:hypothetical protein AGMMS49990_05620 [Endomicrobiia bacterium]
MKTKAMLSAIVLFGLMLSSCDKKNAFLVNRRHATPDRIEQIKEAQRVETKAQQKAKEEEEQKKQKQKQKQIVFGNS